MVIVKSVSAKKIFDSRNEETIEVSIKTNIGFFSGSAPNGKSKGRHAVKVYKKSLEEDIKTLKKFSDYFSKEVIEKFDDLRRIEDILDGHVGANSFFAFESSILKAMAKKQKKEIWQIINPNSKKFPRLVGNCIGGGKHSPAGKKPDFQEFLFIPNLKSIKETHELNKKNKKNTEDVLKKIDKNFKSRKNDEDAWITELNEKEILEILKNLKIPIGLDIAASSFYKNKNYNYKNPFLKRNNELPTVTLDSLISSSSLVGSTIKLSPIL